MYKIGYIGKFETVPQIVEYICNKDIEKLEEEYKNGWDINKKIILSSHTELTPLEIAIQCNNEKVILWLLEKGADVKAKKADWGTLISNGARLCSSEICELLIKHGALENLTKKQLERIYTDIFYGKNFKNIDVFEKFGITVKKYGNNCLRQAVYNKDIKTAQLFLNYGADINYNEPEMVFSSGSTPIMEAVSNNSVEMVKWLVENGADVTIKDKYGDRPYTIAVQDGNMELAEYLKNLEPEEFHNEEAKKSKIKKYKLSKEMIVFFEGGNLKIEFSKDCDSKYIEFYKLEDTIELTWKRKKYLSLVKELENYWLFFLWYPKDKNIYVLDGEHEEIFKIGEWKDFINNCEEVVNKIINGEF